MSQHPEVQWKNPTAFSVRWMQQFRYFCRLFDRIDGLPGDVVECGVGEGTTFVMLAYLAGSGGRSLRGFDSFQGFPQPTPHDTSWRDVKGGEWKTDEGNVWSLLQQSGVFATIPDLSVSITPGFFRDTLPQEPNYPIAFLHLDVDLYESYRDGLEHLFPKVSVGGLILFDEYREYSRAHPDEEKWPGATRAIDEYLIPRGYAPEFYPEVKKYYVVKR